jgi:hypothetical protein
MALLILFPTTLLDPVAQPAEQRTPLSGPKNKTAIEERHRESNPIKAAPCGRCRSPASTQENTLESGSLSHCAHLHFGGNQRVRVYRMVDSYIVYQVQVFPGV